MESSLRDAPPPSNPAAGWHPDPLGGSGFRYWNGAAWTSEVSQTEGGPRTGARASGVVPEEPPKPLRLRAGFATVLLLLTIPVNLWVVFADLGYIDVINQVLDGESVSFSEIDDAESGVDASSTTWVLLRVAVIVAFLLWFARAYYNLPRFGLSDLRYGRGWSIGAWFIPIFNLIRPKQIANDVWRGSDALAEGDRGGWRQRSVAFQLHAWWALVVLGSALGWVFTRIVLSRDQNLSAQEAFDALDDERLAYYVDIASSLIEVAAAVLAVAFIHEVTRRQDQARETAAPS